MNHKLKRLDEQYPPEYAYHVLRGAVEKYSKGIAELTDKELDLVCRQADKTFSLESLVLGSAEVQGIVIQESQVNSAIEELAARYEDYAAFIEDLNGNGVSEDTLYAALHREMLFDAVMNKVAARAPSISDIDVQLFYQMHLERFSSPEIRHARHILITINSEYEDNRREQALKRSQQLYLQLMHDNSQFETLVSKNSECPTAMQGGVLGRIKPGTLYPQLDEALFGMQEGEISKVLESEIGFHILLCEKIEPARELGLSEARAKIRPLLEERQLRNCQKVWLAELKRSSL